MIKAAPVAFAVCLIVGIALTGFAMWGAFNWAYGSVIVQKNAIIENQKERINDLEAKIKEKPQSPTSPVSRDPEGIYQFGIQVGSVQQPLKDESKGIIIFSAIIGAVQLNTDRDFEYRDLVLRIKSFGAESRGHMFGQPGRALNQVTCEIVGRVSRQ